MLHHLFSLPIQQKLSPSLSLTQQDEIPLLIIRHATCQAVVSLQGAQLLVWQPTDHHPVIWLSDKTQFKNNQAIRGGIPLCFPWFGKLHSPSHGFARNVLWSLKEHHENTAGVTLVLHLSDTPHTRKIWDHAFTLTLTLTLGKTSSINLVAQGHYTATAALHSYFSIGDITQTTVCGLGSHYKPSLNAESLFTDTNEIIINQEIDRIYTQPAIESFIHDRERNRTIKITHYQMSDVVLWNPWQTNAIAMDDMADEGYKTMICVESARITRPLTVTEQKPAQFGLLIELLP